MKILISGMGIAGPSLAYWLHEYGHEPVLLERAPAPRTGGYVVDCWGIGYDLCEKMGILPRLLQRGYFLDRIEWVNAKGKPRARFDPEGIRRLCNNRFVSVERSEIAAAILSLVEGKVEMIFGDSIKTISDDTGDRVFVVFENGTPSQLFDLVIGADGQNSNVRELVFGPIENFRTNLHIHICAFEYDNYQPREENVFCSYTEPKRQISRFTKRDNKTLFLFGLRDELLVEAGGFRTSRTECVQIPKTDDSKRALIKRVFRNMPWETPSVLSDPQFEKLEGIYFDRAAQIKMRNWSKGRVALVGDAAACLSPLAGEGTGIALLEAYVLAGEIAKACPAGDDERTRQNYATAFAGYETLLMPFVRKKQASASKVGNTFVPNHKIYIWLRDVLTRCLPDKLTAMIAFAEFKDDIELPVYE